MESICLFIKQLFCRHKKVRYYPATKFTPNGLPVFVRRCRCVRCDKLLSEEKL